MSSFAVNRSNDANVPYPQPPTLNKFGESQIEITYQPLAPLNERFSQVPSTQFNEAYVNSSQPNYAVANKPPGVY